uniref:RING-type domain-containing protein n=2 Tax=Aegilops tauschii subsp. strangulata TaxID=200361 RepID=A0A453E768_AEGTS
AIFHIGGSSLEHLQPLCPQEAHFQPPGVALGWKKISVVPPTAVLCFLLCVVGLAMVARWSLLCNPSAFSVDGPAAKAPCGGLEKKVLQSLPTGSWRLEQREVDEEEGERPECAICLAEFARSDVAPRTPCRSSAPATHRRVGASAAPAKH